MPRPEEIAVIGNGSMGTALAHAAGVAGHGTALWCPDRARADALAARYRQASAEGRGARVRVSPTMSDAVSNAALVIVAVPSADYRETSRALAALDVADRVILSATKAFEPGTSTLLSDVVVQQTGAAAVGVVAGANITTEIVAGRLTALVVASEHPRVGTLAKRSLESEQLRVWPHEDRRSIEIAAALKNVVAVGVGIATGLELGFNARAIVFACGLREIMAVGTALGADPAAFAGVAGTGDLFLTTSSPDSLNRRLGIELGRGARLADVVRALPEVPEGIGSIRTCRELARTHSLRLPISETVAAIVEGERAPNTLEAACRDVVLV